MPATTIVTALGAVSVAVLVASEGRTGRLRPVAKPTASACFIAVALLGGALDTTYGAWVLAALVLSAIGDVALLGGSTPAFLTGLTSFLLGHLAFIVAFAVRGIDVAWMIGVAVALILPLAFVLRWLLPHAGQLVLPVVAYALVISAMVAAAVGTNAHDVDARIVLGAVAFYVSDLAVARSRFVSDDPMNRMWGLPLYYLAQFLLAWTVV